MKFRAVPTLLAPVVVATFALAAAPAPAPKTDILPPARRQQVVDRAAELTKPPAPRPVPADLPPLFITPDFEKPEPDPAKQTAAPTTPGQPAPATPTPAPRTGDREILETLAARLVPSGTFDFRGSPQLVIGQKRFQVGTKFVVSFNNEDYELELVSIDRTTFTLRYRGEEITRPIKPVR